MGDFKLLEHICVNLLTVKRLTQILINGKRLKQAQTHDCQVCWHINAAKFCNNFLSLANSHFTHERLAYTCLTKGVRAHEVVTINEFMNSTQIQVQKAILR